ncbi:hypothetical protein MUP50_00180, partial [Patescibacteria group bacterium]|nr:hypothetical protein [Patescibacteria group bacterium]
DAGADLNTFIWSGTVWSAVHTEHSAGTEDIVDMNFDLVFENHSSNPNDAWLVWGDSATVSRKLWDGGTSAWGTATTSGDDTALIVLNAQPQSGAVFALIYEDDTSATDDITTIQLTGGSQTWSAPSQTWTGPVAANRGSFRITLAYERYLPPTFGQSAYRWFNNQNSTDVGTPLAVQDNTAILGSAGAEFRLRLLLHIGVNSLPQNGQQFKLQFVGKGTGTCAAPSGGTPSTYTDITAATVIAYKDNTTPADGNALTANVNDPTHGADTIVNQTYEELNNFTNSQAIIPSGQDGKWDFALKDNSAPVSTTYCLRVVKSDGVVINTYSVYPEITTAAGGNQPPNSPSSLAQKKTDDTVISTGGWINETSVKFTATASDPDSSDTLSLCVEKDILGTSFSNTEDSCGTGVAYSGSPVTVTVTISGITDANEYHWQARVKDAASAYSSWVAYPTPTPNAESARDFGIDTTAPAGGIIYDGTETGVDKDFNDGSLSQLSANWSGFDANVSGLNYYEYSIGTTAGGTNIKNWTNVGVGTSATATGLTLQTSVLYYFNVRATDNATNTQSAVSSDGQIVSPSLTFSVAPSTLSFANLNAGNSYTDTKQATLTTSTNAYGGYVVRTFMTDYLRSTNSSFTISDFDGGTYASPGTWGGGNKGFGYTSSDITIQGADKFNGGTLYAPFSQTGPGDIIVDHTDNITGSPITNEQFTLTFKVKTNDIQQASSYITSAVYTATAQY